jgi:hypothetical protein
MNIRAIPLRGTSFLSPSWRQPLIVAAGLAAALVVLDIAMPSNALRLWYWMKVVAPSQEARYGFTAGLGANEYCLEVISVVPGGAFASAGVRPGFQPFLPSCFGTHSAELFYASLRAAGEQPLRLTFVPGGCTRTRDGPWERLNVTIRPPKTAG